MYFPTQGARLGRAFDRTPWDRVQVAVFVAFIAVGLAPFVVLLESGLVLNTIGTWTLAAYGILIGAVTMAPVPIRLFRKTPEYSAMGMPNAWTCQGIIVVTAGMLCYCLLLRFNAPAADAPTFDENAFVVDYRHPHAANWQRGTLVVQSAKYGSREIVVSDVVWNFAVADRHVRLVLAQGRLGHPVVTGCEISGLKSIQPVYK